MKAPKHIRRVGAAAALATCALTMSAWPAVAAMRPADPVVITGADTPTLLAAAPSSILAYTRVSGRWAQVPVQVDERAVVSLKKVFNDTTASTDVTALEYTDPNTFTGPDPDPTLDPDDEIAFMARDTVRAIRGYLGANSGPYTQRVDTFYDRREDIHTNLRVHPIGTIMDFFDYSPAAAGMTYRNTLNPLGVTIDGSPDTVVAGPAPYEQVSGPQGGLSIVSTIDTNMPITLTNYYLDDSTPSVTQCTGDSMAYGSSGSYVTGGIDNTDPRNTPAGNHLITDRILYFGSPDIAADDASKRYGQVTYPLAVSESAPPAPKSEARITLKRHSGKRILLAGTVCPGAGAPPVTSLEKRAKNGKFHRVRGLGLKKGKSCWALSTRLSKRYGAYRVSVDATPDIEAGTSRVISVRSAEKH